MEYSVKFNESHLPTCGCSRYRSCFVCKPPSERSTTSIDTSDGGNLLEKHCSEENSGNNEVNQETYRFCTLCEKAWLVPIAQLNANMSEETQGIKTFEEEKGTDPSSSNIQKKCHHSKSKKIDFSGIHIVEEFVSEKEEKYLIEEISKTMFVNSQSGRRKQDFGPKVNFKRQKLKNANFNGLPSYSEFLYHRMKSLPFLADFHPVEMCNLEYLEERGAHIEPHFDDFWIWGNRLVTVNLISDSVLTFTIESRPGVSLEVPMPRHSLIVVFGPARYHWKHSIQVKDINGRRIAMTFRELSAEFQDMGARHEEGQALLDLALTFKGQAIGSR